MNDIITLLDENNVIQEYKLLLVIDKEFKYIVYTDKDNQDFNKKLYAIKVQSLSNQQKTIPINDSEWEMIENEYQKLIQK